MCRPFAIFAIICAELLFSVHCLAGRFTPYMVMPQVGNAWPVDLKDLVVVNGKLLFFAAVTEPSALNFTLWVSDGTANGTMKIYDVAPGWNEVYYRKLMTVGNTLYFSGSNNGISDIELWKSDGTSSGTMRVKDVLPGSDSGYPNCLTNADGTLLFMANGGPDKIGLWKSDGTAEGTVFLKTANLGGGSAREFVNVGGTVFFRSLTVDDCELWKSDGTPEGTVMVKNIRPTGPSYPSKLTPIGNELYFRATDDINVHNWKTDGTEAGTVRVSDRFNVDGIESSSGLLDVNGTLFLGGYDRLTGGELYRTD